MTDRNASTDGETRASTEARVCPSCNESRPADYFKSSHPRTHCDVCHGDRESEPATEAARGRRNVSKRRRLLDALGDSVPDACPVLGLDLDASPRADGRCRPVLRDGAWMSYAAADLLHTVERNRLAPEQVELAAHWMLAAEEIDG